MSRTEAQIEASRLNGAKSRGPVTSDGKAASSRNSLKHGICAATIVIQGENAAAFDEILAALYAEYEPATITEESLVRSMAAALWRQSRTIRVEQSTLDMQMRNEAQNYPQIANYPDLLNATAVSTLGDTSRNLDLILRYEAHYDRQFFRAHKRLLELRNAHQQSGPDRPASSTSARPATRAGVMHDENDENKVVPIKRAQQDAKPAGEQADSSKLPNEPETVPSPAEIAAAAPDEQLPNEPRPDQIRVHSDHSWPSNSRDSLPPNQSATTQTAAAAPDTHGESPS